MTTSEGSLRTKVRHFGKNLDESDGNGLDMCRGETERCSRWSYQARSKEGEPKGRFKDVLREDMQIVGVPKEDTEDRKISRRMIRFGDS